MIRKGIVEHNLSAYEVLQRAIDDVTTDYLLVRSHIDREALTISAQVHHEFKEYMDHLRECMVRYATFAIQYDIQSRALKVSETRVAVLATALKELLQQPEFGLSQEVLVTIPGRLVEIIRGEHMEASNGLNSFHRMTPTRITALAEILDGEAEIEIVDVDPNEPDPSNPLPWTNPHYPLGPDGPTRKQLAEGAQPSPELVAAVTESQSGNGPATRRGAAATAITYPDLTDVKKPGKN